MDIEETEELVAYVHQKWNASTQSQLKQTNNPRSIILKVAFLKYSSEMTPYQKIANTVQLI